MRRSYDIDKEQYTPLSGIESIDKAYIDTGVKYFNNMRVVSDFKLASATTGTFACGFSTSAANWWGSANGYYAVGNSQKTNVKSNLRKSVIVDYTATTIKITVDNSSANQYGTINQTATYKTSFVNYMPANPIIYDIQFIDRSNQEIKYHFVPCKRNSDGEVGLLDIINNNFLTNANSAGYFRQIE